MAAKILNQTQIVSVAQHLCKTARFRQSECKLCEDICPEKAISLSTGPKISSACSNCGLCLNVCPTEAFYSNIDLEQRLAEHMSAPLAAENNFASWAFHCLESKPINFASIGIRCLGNLSELSLLHAAVSGPKALTFAKGQCSECHLAKGGELFDTLLESLGPLCKGIGPDELVINIIQQKREGDIEKVALGRRKLFTGLMRHVFEPIGLEHTPNLIKPSNDPNRKGLSAKKTALNELMSKISVIARDNGRYIPNVPWKKMVVDPAKCNACGICASVCPTGALSKLQSQDQIITTVTSSHCTNCFLCQEACPQRAIDFVKADSLNDLFCQQSVEVARINLAYCVLCGEQLTPAHDSQVCTTCQKRQISWPF